MESRTEGAGFSMPCQDIHPIKKRMQATCSLEWKVVGLLEVGNQAVELTRNWNELQGKSACTYTRHC